jgi:hypothetical protein
MERRYVLFGFAFFFVLCATTQTQAGIQPNPNISQNKGSKGIVFVNHDRLLQIANSRGARFLHSRYRSTIWRSWPLLVQRGADAHLRKRLLAVGNA